MAFVAPFIMQVDAGVPIMLLGGIHAGCFELFGTERVRAIRDLKGRTVAVPGLTSPHYIFLASMAAYVGVDPKRDINFVIYPAADSMQLLAEGKIDALVGFPPVPQELREKKIGHVIVSSALDRPWSQYFCCIPAAHQDFIRKHPVATKRALRAIVKAANFCAAEPERAARLVADSAAIARSGHDQVVSQQDHRAGYRLALFQRAKARAEELMTRVVYCGACAASGTSRQLPTY